MHAPSLAALAATLTMFRLIGEIASYDINSSQMHQTQSLSPCAFARQRATATFRSERAVCMCLYWLLEGRLDAPN